ncbi:hypothetical protein H1C71_014956 [Ictidomys tridecemlineatus]|nr:hypothetical protein H1C71_014956 [Ictidomys tridecemlineatus]
MHFGFHQPIACVPPASASLQFRFRFPAELILNLLLQRESASYLPGTGDDGDGLAQSQLIQSSNIFVTCLLERLPPTPVTSVLKQDEKTLSISSAFLTRLLGRQRACLFLESHFPSCPFSCRLPTPALCRISKQRNIYIYRIQVLLPNKQPPGPGQLRDSPAGCP